MEEYTVRRQRRDFQEALPLPLSDTRLFTLPSQLTRQTLNTSQLQSNLLGRLPAEVRVLIWEYVIGYQELHIISKYRRLGHAVCNAEYWAENHAERPGLRASSYMFTYGSLPTTKQLADWSMCNLLRTCRLVYAEALPVLYTANTFIFRDIRVLPIFRPSIPTTRWATIRSISLYAMFYRHEDIPSTCEARSVLQLEAWPTAVSALKSLPNLRALRIWIGSPFYMDQKYLNGSKAGLYDAVKAFLVQCKGVKVNGEFEVILPMEKDIAKGSERWNTYALKEEAGMKLEMELRAEGIECKVFEANH